MSQASWPPVASAQPEVEHYPLKRVHFGAVDTSIVLQNVNGPCPLIAIANTLLLRGAIDIPPEHAVITADDLVARLTLYAHELYRLHYSDTSGVSDEVAANAQANLVNGISILQGPALRHGMNINCSLTQIDSFEFTQEIGVFDLFRIPLVHGWICGPDEEEVFKVFQGKTFNQVQDLVCFVHSLKHVVPCTRTGL